MDDFYYKEILSRLTKVEIVFETEYALAFHHAKPYWPVHIVVIPKEHTLPLATADPDALNEVLKVVQESAKQVLKKHDGCEALTNMGSYQDTMHMHWHVISGKPIRQLTAETLIQKENLVQTVFTISLTYKPLFSCATCFIRLPLLD